MPTLRSIFKSADSRPHPATPASVGPSPSPVTAPDVLHWVGEGPTSIVCPHCGTPSGPFSLAGARFGTYTCALCGWRAELLRAVEWITCTNCPCSGPGDIVMQRPDAFMVACRNCGCTQWVNRPDNKKIVGGDVPLEGGDSPSLPTTIDRINKALIEATAIMREQNDQLAAVHAALDQYEADLAARKHGGVAQDRCYWSVRHAVGR